MPLSSIAYCSDLVVGLTVAEIDAMVRDAARHNRLAGVTGVLICDGFRFLQYIEGPDDGIALVYSRVINSRRHTHVIELGRGRLGERRFPHWSMHWIPLEQHELHAAAVADWTGMNARGSASELAIPGMEQLAILAASAVEDVRGTL